MDLLQYISKEGLILIPVLYAIGIAIKKANHIQDNWIPLLLMIISIPLTMGLLGFNLNSAIQGILISSSAVGLNQIPRQIKKIKQ